MRSWQRIAKRAFDILVAAMGLVFLGPIIAVAALVACWDTGKNGFFSQLRVGQNGRLFRVIKIRTMRDVVGITTTATTARDPRITTCGRLFRKFKIDELPQLWNVLVGDMSMVGPRPDVPSLLATIPAGERAEILSIRPGITGPATLRYRNEELLLARQTNPDRYNTEVIFPDKVRINRAYIREFSFLRDIVYLWKTVFPVAIDSAQFEPTLAHTAVPATQRPARGRRAA